MKTKYRDAKNHNHALKLATHNNSQTRLLPFSASCEMQLRGKKIFPHLPGYTTIMLVLLKLTHIFIDVYN